MTRKLVQGSPFSQQGQMKGRSSWAQTEENPLDQASACDGGGDFSSGFPTSSLHPPLGHAIQTGRSLLVIFRCEQVQSVVQLRLARRLWPRCCQGALTRWLSCVLFFLQASPRLRLELELLCRHSWGRRAMKQAVPCRRARNDDMAIAMADLLLAAAPASIRSGQRADVDHRLAFRRGLSLKRLIQPDIFIKKPAVLQVESTACQTSCIITAMVS